MFGHANSDPVFNHPHVRTTGRAKSTAHPRGSSLHATQKVSGRLSSSTSHPVPEQTPENDPDETEDEDWKQMGVAALRRSARPNLTPTGMLFEIMNS